jgi:hypothetical protein
VSDFRDRFGDLLSAAAASLAAAPSAAAAERVDFRDRVGVALGDAAVSLAAARRAERVARPRSGPRAWVGPLVRRPALAAVAFAALAGTATGASIWLPTLGDQRYGGNPGISASSPPQAELDALAVLSRPQTDADRGAMTDAVLADVNSATKGVRTSYVRLLAGSGDTAFVLVPVVERDSPSDGGPPSAPPLRDALCVYAAAQPTTSAQCWSLAQVLSAAAFAQLGDQLFGLAPDGAVAAHVTVGGGQTLTASVQNNFFDVSLPQTGGLPSTPVVSFSGS